EPDDVTVQSPNLPDTSGLEAKLTPVMGGKSAGGTVATVIWAAGTVRVSIFNSTVPSRIRYAHICPARFDRFFKLVALMSKTFHIGSDKIACFFEVHDSPSRCANVSATSRWPTSSG